VSAETSARPGQQKAPGQQRAPANKAAERQTRLAAARRRRQQRLFFWTTLVAVAALAVVFVVARSGAGGGSGSSPAFVVGRPGPGQAAPPIQLPSTAGGTFDLAAQRGKTVLLYFQEGIGCQPCWDQIRDIEKNVGQFHALGIDEIVSIAGNPLSQLRQKVADERLSTPVLADPDLSLGNSYQANHYGMMGTGAYGHSFIVVKADGIIAYRADFGGSPNYTMYVAPSALLSDLRAGLAKA
jgi:peroxiredoxin